jgi:uncharacterized phage protein (TIGR01671 family)
MENRFKFKGIHPVLNEMQEVKFLDFIHNTVDFGDGDIFDIEGIKLLQCTGKKDKNGKLIYEGDVLKEYYVDIDYGGSEDTTKVEFSPLIAGFIMTRDNYKNDITLFDEVDLNNFEVIGNITEGNK